MKYFVHTIKPKRDAKSRSEAQSYERSRKRDDRAIVNQIVTPASGQIENYGTRVRQC